MQNGLWTGCGIVSQCLLQYIHHASCMLQPGTGLLLGQEGAQY